jgi:hypothetical protein
VGFDLSANPFPLTTLALADFRIRRDDALKLGTKATAAHARNGGEEGGEEEGEEPGPVGVDGVYFPLLATILPKWRAVVHGAAAPGASAPVSKQPQQQHPQVFKVVFLVSGVGMPRDPSSSATGNSTEGAYVCRVCVVCVGCVSCVWV